MCDLYKPLFCKTLELILLFDSFTGRINLFNVDFGAIQKSMSNN